MAPEPRSSRPPPPNATLSNLVRLAPLQLDDLPPHPNLRASASSQSASDQAFPLLFLTTLLDDGADFLASASFSKQFKHRSTKSTPPSTAPVDVLSYSVPARPLEAIDWSGGNKNNNNPGPYETPPKPPRASRSKPRTLPSGEHWFARKSTHKDISAKDARNPGHASWREFVYGLRDEHSKREADFTPPLYDAHRVCDWDAQVGELAAQGKITGRNGTRYTCVSLGVYEMCHALPAPLSPRCFPVLVATASVDEDCFLAVTVPVALGPGTKSPGAFYSSRRNVREGKTAQQRKPAVLGVYAAVETVRRNTPTGEVEWIMATASDAKGNLPMWVQKLSVPGVVPNDVKFFMHWIKTVQEEHYQDVKLA